MSERNVLLCLPPNYCFHYNVFPLGTAMLAGYLKKHGIDASQIDLNVGYLEYWKKKIWGDNPESTAAYRETGLSVVRLLNTLFQEKAHKGYYFSEMLLQETSPKYVDVTNSSFAFAEKLLSSEHLFRYLDDGVENTFLAYYLEEGIISLLREEKVDILGISVIAPSQAIAALTLGRLVKKTLPDIHIVMGGQWVSLFRNEIALRSDLSACCDSFIYFEGETPLKSLVQAARGRKNLQDVPNLIYQSGGRFVWSGVVSKEDMNNLACPDFDGIQLQEYAMARRMGKAVLTYQTARECYWNRCVYCVDLPLPKQGYRERSMDLIIADLKELISKYGMSFLEISNATMSPRQMAAFSDGVIKNNFSFQWRTFARMDDGFTRDVLRRAKDAGCMSLLFGLESASQRILDFIRKGIDVRVARRIVSDCYDLGIDVHLQMMLGLPSETAAEATETVSFLIEQRGKNCDVTFNTYYVTPACEVYLDPERYGISYTKHPELPFKFFHEYSHLTGDLDERKAERFRQIYHTLLRERSERSGQKQIPRQEEAGLRCRERILSVAIGAESISLPFKLQVKSSAEEAVRTDELVRACS